jgi:hypothetical protein
MNTQTASKATTNVEIARAAYNAHVTKDRAALDGLLAGDFHFTSPLDNRLDRDTYFRRCWPNSKTIAGFDFINLIADGIACSSRMKDAIRAVIDFGIPRSLRFETPTLSMSRCISDGPSRIRRRGAAS